MCLRKLKSYTAGVCLLGFVLGIWGFGTTIAQIPYEIGKPNPITEPWRWTELEALRNEVLFCGAEDEAGVLWFGTTGYVVSYDGRSVERHSYPHDFTSAWPLGLFANGEDDLFVFTSLGILRLQAGVWQVMMEYAQPERGIWASDRSLMAKNSRGLTVLAAQEGLYVLNEDRLTPLAGVEERVSSVLFDNDDNLWCVAGGGRVLKKLSGLKATEPHNFRLQEYPFNHPLSIWLRTVYNDLQDELLVHTWQPELPAHRYQKDSDSFVEETIGGFKKDYHTNAQPVGSHGFLLFAKSALVFSNDENWSALELHGLELPFNHVFSFQRKNGNVVIGGRGEPIYEIDYSSQYWDSFENLIFQCEDKDGRFWFISLGGEVISYNPEVKDAIRYEAGVIDLPLAITCSSDGTIWVSGAHEDVAAVSYFNGQDWTLDIHPKLNDRINYLSVLELLSGEMAFGGGYEFSREPGGMVLYRKQEDNYEFSYVLTPRVPNQIVGLAQTGPEDLWFGGRELSKSSYPEFEVFEPVVEPVGDFGVLWYDHIASDGQGGLWVGTWGRGLFHYQDNHWIHYNSENGLKSDQVLYVLNDSLRPDTTWVVTRTGLSKFQNGSWINGVIPHKFSFSREGTTLKQSSDGAIWINTTRRDWFYRKLPEAPVDLSPGYLFKSVRYFPDTEPPEVQLVQCPETATSPSSVHIQWQGADEWSLTPEKSLEYAYRLDDGDWSPYSTETSLMLTGLSNGAHGFEVKVRDLDGNESRSTAAASFSVVPPLWQRAWFMVSIIMLCMLVIVLVGLLIHQRIKSILRLEEFKLQFFTNLSHELRTPLSLILGPLDQLENNLPKRVDSTPLQIAKRNAKKLLHLVDEILEFRKTKLGKVELHPSHEDLMEVVRNSVQSADPLSAEKNQKIFLTSQLNTFPAWFDSDALSKILDNLILNAIKYTENGCEITVKVSVVDGGPGDTITTNIAVEDTGIGIPADKTSLIFDPFYRIHKSVGKAGGSGLGLALAKSLVEGFGGDILVESPICVIKGMSKGTRFTVNLPMKKLSPIEQKEEEAPIRLPGNRRKSQQETLKEEKASTCDSSNKDSKPKILLVEDDEDMLQYLKSELEQDYRVLAAGNGNAGLILAAQEIPDLILSDLRMPKMDGKELCHRIKSDEFTCHIPVFILTALKSDRHQKLSLEKGADGFFTKPVNMSVLKQQIHNLFESRKVLHDRYQKLVSGPTFDSEEITSNQLDDSFLQRSMHIIEKHLSDPMFDVEKFASLMHGSRMTLYRKFKALTGESPSQCVRRLRMLKAAELLKGGEYNVSEVSDLVGMQDVSYFSTAFKKHFGVTPTDFIAKSKATIETGD